MITDFTTHELNKELRRRELLQFSINEIKNELNRREEVTHDCNALSNRFAIEKHKGLTQALLLHDVDINKISKISTKQIDIDGKLEIVLEIHTYDKRVIIFDIRNCEIIKEY